MTTLCVSNLLKKYGGNSVCNNISFCVKPNKINLLIGANGSGKTSLINAISGLSDINSGDVLFCDDIISKKPIYEIFNLGLTRTFQTPRLFSNLSVLENLLMAQRSDGESFRTVFSSRWKKHESILKQKALSVLDSLNLLSLSDNLAYDLSGGQIKLLELGKTLMSESKLVLLDEPIAGIHPTLAHKIFDKISDICKNNKTTFLIVEHRLDIAMQYADFVFVLSEGSIIAQDTPDKILSLKKVIDSYLR